MQYIRSTTQKIKYQPNNAVKTNPNAAPEKKQKAIEIRSSVII